MTVAPAAFANCMHWSAVSLKPGIQSPKAYLQSKDANAASPLRQNDIAWHDHPTLQAVEAVPRRQGYTTQRSRLLKVQILRHRHKAILIKDSILSKTTIFRAPRPVVVADGVSGP